jgi:nicotinamidase-related amidase
MHPALLLIDIQNDYFPGGANELENSSHAGIAAGKVLEAFRKRGYPVIHIQHISTRPGATFFLPDTTGAEIHESVKPRSGEPVFVKHFPNSFRETGLENYLKENGIQKLVMAGMMTHMCVDSTVRAAFDAGFECTLVHDGCSTRALKFGDKLIPAQQVHESFIAALGMFAAVKDGAGLIAAL